MTKKEFIEALRDYPTTTYDAHQPFVDLVFDYMREHNDYSLEKYFEDVITAEEADDRLLEEAKDGIQRAHYFINGINYWDDIYRVNAYGNLENVDSTWLKYTIQQMLEDLENEDN